MCRGEKTQQSKASLDSCPFVTMVKGGGEEQGGQSAQGHFIFSLSWPSIQHNKLVQRFWEKKNNQHTGGRFQLLKLLQVLTPIKECKFSPCELKTLVNQLILKVINQEKMPNVHRLYFLFIASCGFVSIFSDISQYRLTN